MNMPKSRRACFRQKQQANRTSCELQRTCKAGAKSPDEAVTGKNRQTISCEALQPGQLFLFLWVLYFLL